MKIQIEHDDAGKIYTVFAPTGGSITTVLRPGNRRRISAVDAEFVEHPADFDNLRRIIPEYRIKGHASRAKLVKVNDDSALTE
jgi:hypothetical protein